MTEFSKTRRMLLAAPIAFAIGLTAFGAAAQNVTMRLGHELPLDSPTHRALETFAANVKSASDGRIDIKLFGAAVLGPDRAISEQVRLGGIDMAALGINVQAPLSEDFTIEELPYAWDNYAQLAAAFEGDLGRIFSEKFTALGARPISFFPFGFRHLTNNVRPVRTPDDLKGMKLRMAEVPIRMDTFQTLGAQPVPIAFPELFTALQQGTVDGQENPLFIIKGSRFFEVQKYLSLTRHIGTTYFLVINEAKFQSLPEDVRTILTAEAAKISPQVTKELEDGEAGILTFLKENGVEIVEDIDRAAFREKLKPVYEKYKARFSPELWAVMEKYSSINK